MNLPYKKFKISQLPFRFSYEKIGLPTAVLIISIVFGLLNPVFFSFNNLMNIGRQVAFIGLIAWGQTMIIICGGIDLSVGKMTAFISVIMATIIMHYSSSVFGVIVAIIVSMLLGVLIGYIKGLIIGFLKIPPFIATLAFYSILAGGALTFTSGTVIFGLESEFFKWIGNGKYFGVPISFMIMILFLFITYIIMHKTKLGYYTYSIGANERAAILSGINVFRYKLYIYIYANLLVAIAAILMTSRVNSGQPLLGTGLELKTIAAVCIGGTSLFGGVGSIIGTFYGVILIGILNNGLNILGVSSFIQEIVIGITILLAVLISIIRKNNIESK